MIAQTLLKDVVLQLGLRDSALILLGFAIVQFLVSLLITERVKTSLQKELEDYRNSLRTREQAARVAELLALAFSPNADPVRFNQLAWELSLWLPAPLVCDLTRCLVGDSSSKTPKEILIEVRKILLQAPNDPLRAENLVHREDPSGKANLTAALIKDPIAKSLTK